MPTKEAGIINVSSFIHVPVLMPCFNRPAAAALALQSIAVQDVPWVRDVYIRDGGDVAITECREVRCILDYMTLQGITIHYVRARANTDLVSQREALIAMLPADLSPATWILEMDDDTLLVPNYISQLLLAVKTTQTKTPVVALSGSFIDTDNVQTRKNYATTCSSQAFTQLSASDKLHVLCETAAYPVTELHGGVRLSWLGAMRNRPSIAGITRGPAEDTLRSFLLGKMGTLLHVPSVAAYNMATPTSGWTWMKHSIELFMEKLVSTGVIAKDRP